MFMRKMMVLIFILSCGASSACAQSFEVTPFGGGKFGGTIPVNSSGVNDILIKSSVDYGALFDYTFWDTFQGEFMWDHQPTTLSANNTNGTVDKLSNINLDTYQFGLVYNFRDPSANLRPFIVGGIGFTHYGRATDSSTGQSILPFGNRLSYSIGGGVKYYFTHLMGLRLDARWAPSRTTAGQGQICDPFSGFCTTVRTSNHAEQFQTNLGLIFRF